uniref:(California timema) hypothetical protein n=1 Tax=Timema californicum TaxID=61474 RepID=A0A7R9PCU1_TIMCA|nr:unnamed protein product [Timema californicum]
MINVMTYDFHGSWDTITGENAPMYADSSETTELARGLNVDTCIQNWLDKGAPASKINLGMGTYGRSFTLQSADNSGLGAPINGAGQAGPYTREAGTLGYNEDTCIQNWLDKGAPASKINLGMGTYGRSFTLQSADNSGLGAPINGAGQAGPYTREAGTLGYNEICEQKGQWTEHWNDDQQVPYAVNGNQWVGYDNVKSIGIKSEYVKAKNLGGAMIWSVETDDFRGICGDKYPLLNAINSVLNGQSLPTVVPTAGPTTTTDPDNPAPPTTTTTTTPKPNPPDTGLCTQPGYVRDPSDCQVYYQCVDEGGFYEIFKFKCSDGTYFDPTIDVCNYTDEIPEHLFEVVLTQDISEIWDALEAIWSVLHWECHTPGIWDSTSSPIWKRQIGNYCYKTSKKRDSQQEQRLPNFTGRTSMRKRTSTHDINSKTTKRCDPSAAFRRYAPPLASGTTWTPRTA